MVFIRPFARAAHRLSGNAGSASPSLSRRPGQARARQHPRGDQQNEADSPPPSPTLTRKPYPGHVALLHRPGLPRPVRSGRIVPVPFRISTSFRAIALQPE